MNKRVKTCNVDTESYYGLILATLKIRGSVRNEEIITRRNFSKFNETAYLMDLMGLRWSEIYDIKDPTLNDSAITDRILSVLDIHAPVQTFRVGGRKNDGNKKLSKECLYRIRYRNKLRRQARRLNLTDDWEKWKVEKIELITCLEVKRKVMIGLSNLLRRRI